jgi:UPF0716 protein FxsA
MAFFLIIALIAVPIMEIAVFIEVGEWAGLWPTLAAVIATAVIGGAMLRIQGLVTLHRAMAALERQELPVAEIFDGIALLLAGALLLTPGFVTDGVGMLLLIPPVRALLRSQIWRYLTTYGRTRVWVDGEAIDPDDYHGKSNRRGPIIDGEFEEIRPDARHQPATPRVRPPDR